jgi:hypothetical protein
VDFLQHVARAIAAAAAARSDAEVNSQLFERPRPGTGALFELALGYGIADADVQGASETRTIIN